MNTGKHSILNRIRGNARAIHEQIKFQSDWTYNEIYDLMKMLSIENGYPAKTLERNRSGESRYYKVARSLSGQSNENANILNQTIQEFADSNGFWLIEYDEKEIPFKSIGGKTKNEMIKYIEWLEEKNRHDEARELKKEVKDDKIAD